MSKYYKYYTDIITKAQVASRIKSKDHYYENHHVTPKSLGGADTAENLVLLTAREHFLCHKLLLKHYLAISDEEKAFKMALAFRFLSGGIAKDKLGLRTLTSREYDTVKGVISKRMQGAGNPMYGKVSPNRGKSIEVTPSRRKAYTARRTLLAEISWENPASGTLFTGTVYAVAEKYSLDYRKLREIVLPGYSRTTHKGWNIVGVDCRNKKIRESTAVVYEFHNIEKLICFKGTIDELLNLDTSLTYASVKAMTTSNEKEVPCSVKKWTLSYTYNLREEAIITSDIRIYTLINRHSGHILKGTARELAVTLKRKKGKLMEYLKYPNRKTKGIGFANGWDLHE